MTRLALISLCWLAIASPALAETIAAADVRVVDGDTIAHKGEAFRLIGFDTPEIGLAKCDAERRLARLAARRLTAIVTAGSLDLTRVACSCRKGTEGTRYCNFGRSCGVLMADSRPVSEILIDESYARSYQCAGTKCPPRKSWCER